MNDTQLMTLAREYGTPLYLFEQTALRDRVALLRECLPARAELCLAIKANPFALPIIRPYVHRLEVCSPGELNICEACGTAPPCSRSSTTPRRISIWPPPCWAPCSADRKSTRLNSSHRL